MAGDQPLSELENFGLGAREGREAARDPEDGQQSGRERGSKATGWGGPGGAVATMVTTVMLHGGGGFGR